VQFSAEQKSGRISVSLGKRRKSASAHNLWKREFQPRLDPVGLGWVNFQVLRRTNASLSRKANVDDKVSADQRAHGLGVSMNVYAISDLEQKIEAVTKLEAEVTRSERAELERLGLQEISSLEATKRKRSNRSTTDETQVF
jgi:hypothetical protein